MLNALIYMQDSQEDQLLADGTFLWKIKIIYLSIYLSILNFWL